VTGAGDRTWVRVSCSEARPLRAHPPPAVSLTMPHRGTSGPSSLRPYQALRHACRTAPRHSTPAKLRPAREIRASRVLFFYQEYAGRCFRLCWRSVCRISATIRQKVADKGTHEGTKCYEVSHASAHGDPRLWVRDASDGRGAMLRRSACRSDNTFMLRQR
jgi:hypothetical protein